MLCQGPEQALHSYPGSCIVTGVGELKLIRSQQNTILKLKAPTGVCSGEHIEVISKKNNVEGSIKFRWTRRGPRR